MCRNTYAPIFAPYFQIILKFGPRPFPVGTVTYVVTIESSKTPQHILGISHYCAVEIICSYVKYRTKNTNTHIVQFSLGENKFTN